MIDGGIVALRGLNFLRVVWRSGEAPGLGCPPGCRDEAGAHVAKVALLSRNARSDPRLRGVAFRNRGGQLGGRGEHRVFFDLGQGRRVKPPNRGLETVGRFGSGRFMRR